MTYGPPQRFKAVDINSGDVLSHMAMEFWCCDESNKVLGFHCAYPTDTEPHEWPLATNEVKFYQSTGRHDANGKEVFFGDVLLNIEPRMGVHPGVFVAVVFVDGQIFMRCDGRALDMSDPPSKGYYRIEKCDSFAVIGNIHHSSEQLQAAAEKVRAERGLL